MLSRCFTHRPFLLPAGLSSLTAIDGDFFPEEVLAWADMHLTRLTLSSSYNLTLHGMAGLVPQLKSLVGSWHNLGKMFHWKRALSWKVANQGLIPL
eukprot:1159613-Pelagomonas_calceolata.AAC.7